MANDSGFRKGLVFLALALALLVAACGSDSNKEIAFEDDPVPVMWGMVHLDDPVTQAKVEVYVDDTLVWSGWCEEGRFWERTDVVPAGAIRVVVSNILLNESYINSTLSLYEPEYEAGSFLSVNLFTTLVDRYRIAYDKNAEEAALAIKRHFHLPLERDFVNKLHYGSKGQYFDVATLLNRAQEYPSLDSYLNQLIGQIDEEPTANRLGSLYSNLGSFYSEIATGIASGVASSLAEKATGSLLEKFHLAAHEITNQDILAALAAQNLRLEAIELKVDQIANMVKHLQEEVTQGFADLLFESADHDIASAITNLNLLMDEMRINFSTAAAEQAAQSGDLEQARNFARSIIGRNATSQRDIIHMAYLIHDVAVRKNTDGGRNALGHYAIRLSQGGNPHDLLARYKAFEAYFGRILAYQYRILTLVHEAVNVLDTNEDIKYNKNTIDQFIAEVYQPYIDDLVDEFLTWVDYLVFANADYATDLVKPRSFLPADTGTIFQRADFIAQQFSTKHPQGIALRLVGQPTAIDKFLATTPLEIIQLQGDDQLLLPLTLVYEANYNLKNPLYLVTTNTTPKWELPYIEWKADLEGPQRTKGCGPLNLFPCPRHPKAGTSVSTIRVAKLVIKIDDDVRDGLTANQGKWYLAGKVLELKDSFAGDVRMLANNYEIDPDTFNYHQVDQATEHSFLFGSHLFPVRDLPDMGRFDKVLSSGNASPASNNTSHVVSSPTLMLNVLESEITNVKEDRHDHYVAGEVTTTWSYRVEHGVTNIAQFNFVLDAPTTEKWQVLINSKLRSGHDSGWNIKTTGTMQVYWDPDHVQTLVSTHITNPYKWTKGSKELVIPSASKAHSLWVSASMDGGVNETYGNRKSRPRYTVKSGPDFEEIRIFAAP